LNETGSWRTMNQDKLIDSPCIRNCCLNEDDICLGCFRSLPEVIAWSGADNQARKQILENATGRRLAYHEKYRLSPEP
jgi:predicted Fe-S protein YdhL (DUF1289 family)